MTCSEPNCFKCKIADIYGLIDSQYQSIIVNNPETKLLESDLKSIVNKIDSDDFEFSDSEGETIAWVLNMELDNCDEEDEIRYNEILDQL